MTHSSSNNNFLNDLLETASDDLYIKEIVRSFETRQMAMLSQALFEVYTLTAMLFEKIKRSDKLTRLTQVYEATPSTEDKREACLLWTQVWLNNGLFFTAGIANSIDQRNIQGKTQSEQELCSHVTARRKIASGFREIGAIFTILREAINQDSHTSCLSIGGGIVLTAAPLKIIETSERVLLLTSELVRHRLFEEDEYMQDGKDLTSSTAKCRLLLAEFKSSIDAEGLKALLAKGMPHKTETPFPKESADGENEASMPDSQPASSAEIKAHFGNLVMLISKNILHIQDEVRNSSLQITDVIDRTSEKNLSLLKSELSAATIDISAKLESGSIKAYPPKDASTWRQTTTRSNTSKDARKISQQEAGGRLESLKHEITAKAKQVFASQGKSVEYYHCIVNKTMYEAYMYNRITDIRSDRAKEFIDRLITSRNPRHLEVVRWQIENYADEINSILSNIAYPLYTDENADEVPF